MRPFSILLLASPLLASPFLLTPSFLGAGTAAFITLVKYRTFCELVFSGFMTGYSISIWLKNLMNNPLFQGGTTITVAEVAPLLGLASLGAVVKVTRVYMICHEIIII